MHPRVVILENDDIQRRYLATSLKTNFEVLEFRLTSESIEDIRENKPNLVICECCDQMNKIQQLIKRIAEEDETKEIPFLFTYTNVNEEERIREFPVQLKDSIRKPINTRVLLIKAKNLVQKSPLKRRKSIWKNKVNPYGINSVDYNHEFVEKVSIIISSNLTNPNLSVKMIIDEMCMTMSTFERYFEKNFHNSAKSYIRDLRLEKAMIMLRGGITNTADLSYSLGFNSVSYFCKCFKDKFGVTTSKVQNED